MVEGLPFVTASESVERLAPGITGDAAAAGRGDNGRPDSGEMKRQLLILGPAKGGGSEWRVEVRGGVYGGGRKGGVAVYPPAPAAGVHRLLASNGVWVPAFPGAWTGLVPFDRVAGGGENHGGHRDVAQPRDRGPVPWAQRKGG